MSHTIKTIFIWFTALLLCFGTLALAGPPEGKGGGKGNKPVDATASFTMGDIKSSGELQGELIDNGGFDTLEGQLAGAEFISVGGDAGHGLAAIEAADGMFLPPGTTAYCADESGAPPCLVTFSGATWTIRLDRDKEPANRVQFKMRWVNEAGLERHLRIGWVVQAYENEKYPLDSEDYGDSDGSTTLESATVIFDSDLFRIDGDIEVAGKGKKKKTELEVFSRYGETFDTVTPWCSTMGTTDDGTTVVECRASTTIVTALPVN